LGRVGCGQTLEGIGQPDAAVAAGMRLQDAAHENRGAAAPHSRLHQVSGNAARQDYIGADHRKRSLPSLRSMTAPRFSAFGDHADRGPEKAGGRQPEWSDARMTGEKTSVGMPFDWAVGVWGLGKPYQNELGNLAGTYAWAMDVCI